MTLYQIEESIMECADDETGEIIDFERLERLFADKRSKIDNIACWYKQLNAEAAAIENEIEALSRRRKSKTGKAESLKRCLADALCGEKFESVRNKISWRISDETAVINEALIPFDYKTETLEIKANKTAVKKAIKSGTVIPGAELIFKNNIQIS